MPNYLSYFYKHIRYFKSNVFVILLAFSISSYGQTLVWDWSNDYSISESTMAIGISESSIDQVTVQGNTFPVGGVIGVFYENNWSKSQLLSVNTRNHFFSKPNNLPHECPVLFGNLFQKQSDFCDFS